MRTPIPKLLRRIRRRGLRLVPAAPAAPDPLASEPEAIVNAFNELESHLEGMRDAGRRLALASRSLRTSARHMAITVERLETPARGNRAIGAPSERARRAHLQLLDPVA